MCEHSISFWHTSRDRRNEQKIEEKGKHLEYIEEQKRKKKGLRNTDLQRQLHGACEPRLVLSLGFGMLVTLI